jgi:fluorothreonine transaldolase
MTLTLHEIDALIREEEAEDRDFVHLTSNETLMSPLASQVLSSPLGNRYLLEHIDMRQDSPSRLNGFLFRGLDRVNAIERSAIEVCRQMFAAEQVELRCISGLHAMQTTLVSLTEPGDVVMRFGVADGGHFATENIIKLFGRKSTTYAFDRERLTIDLDATEQIFKRDRPKLLYLDAMNYLFPFPIRQLREIVGDTPILYDASHTLGLIAGGQFQNPLLEGADILQANTHKTFFGPQKGIILARNRELLERVSYSLSQGLVSSQHTASLLSLCIALHEMQQVGPAFARQVIANARYLAARMADAGLPVLARSDGEHTANHHFFLDMTGRTSASHAMERLLRAHLSVHRGVPFRNVDGLRIGVQEITRRGYTHADLDRIAEWFAAIVLGGTPPEEIAPLVMALARSRRDILFTGDAPSVTAAAVASPVATVATKDAVADAGDRWVDFERQPAPFQIDASKVLQIRELGALAGAFPNQTDATGNLSARDGDDVLVTTSGCYIKHLEAHHFVRLLNYRDGVLQYAGTGVPSSESLMHFLIYQTTDAGAVAHTHYLLSNQEAEALGVAIVPPQEYASVELARRVAEACRTHAIVYVQKHGLIFHALDIDACRLAVADFIQQSQGLRHAD